MVWQVGGLSLSPCVMHSTFWGAKPYEFFDHTGYSRGDIQAVLDRILRTAQFRFDNKEQLWLALQDSQTGKADFSD